MDAHPHCDVEAEPRAYPIAEPVHFAGDVEARLYRSPHVVLVGAGVAEHGKQAVALGGEDVPLVAVDDLVDLLSVAADHRPVDLRLDAGRQRG
nr:hypothetical protein CPGR_00377 [Mycolicibacter nonchromogenicus]